MKKKYLKSYKDIKMFNKSLYKRKLLLMVAVSTAVLFAGCQSENIASNNSITENNPVINIKESEKDSEEADSIMDLKETEKDSAEAIALAELNTAEVIPSVEESNREESGLEFSELSRCQFIFSSGAGAWQTILNINEDGTFKGEFMDSDMGNTGEDYPYGKNYSSRFEGEFTTPERVNDYTYSMTIKHIELEKEVGSEEIIDGIKYIYSEPYGLEDAKEIYIYTPQAPLKELPEGFRSWVGYRVLSDEKGEYLPFYGLYNVKAGSGFSSYMIDEIKESNTEFDIIAEVAEIEKQAEKLNQRLKNEDLNQSEMNFLAKDIYVLWDDEINKVWGYLKDTLDKDSMDKLTSVQREWIAMKENEINKAGSVYEGGSIRPMIEYLKGAELTRDRVYELIELIK
ncbi:MAG TPA: DUF1311 domain-containing protein [Clostridiales bacterium]|mgnify:CR=1 FL=1|nr:DUF1311 domain-containing protein [Clostridiales bacterium]